MSVINFENRIPHVEATAFIAPSAWVIGDCHIGPESSVYFNAVLRGDIQSIRVGRGTNIQEFSLLHTSDGRNPCIVGDYCTLGHSSIVHGCKLGNQVLVGMSAVILDDAQIGDNCLIGANSLITSGMMIPPGSLVLGSPAKVIRQLDAAEIESLMLSAKGYIKRSAWYLEQFKK